ncbi:MAG: methyltransferase domain-containing protein [Xanthomonadales bacterium]|nr:methyltransferase domain-containing protein [Xanthomonadales bacterium]
MEPLALTTSTEQEFEIAARRMLALDTGGRPLQVLEAGCGRQWRVDLGGRPVELTGVDLDEDAVRARQQEHADLDHVHIADLNEIDFPTASFDVVFSSYVLEHVEQADRTLENFHRWLRPGGLIILRIPDPRSVYGFVARVTPHWFHVAVYRWLFGDRNAGKPGFAPYRVHYHPVVSREGIHQFAQRNGYEILDEYGDGWYRPGAGWKGRLVTLAKRTLSVLSLGALSARHTNLFYVLRESAGSQPAATA